LAMNSLVKTNEISDAISSLDSGIIALARSQAPFCGLLQHELGARHLGNAAAIGDQFVESSSFDHAAAIEYQDAGGVANRREPVRDHERGPPLHHFVERRIDLGF